MTDIISAAGPNTPGLHLAGKAEQYAPDVFARRNMTYDGLPYETHLRMAVKFADYFRPLLNITTDQFHKIIAAIWLHDTIEDCGVNYNEIKRAFGTEVADMVWSVTGFGKNRKERSDCVKPKIYGSIANTFIKLCDKLANLVYSKWVASSLSTSMYSKYVSEWPEFRATYYIPELADMFDYYEKLIDLK